MNEVKTINVFGKQIQIAPNGYIVTVEKAGNENSVSITSTTQSGMVQSVIIDTVRLYAKYPNEFIREFNIQCQLSLGMNNLSSKELASAEFIPMKKTVDRSNDISSNQHIFRCIDVMNADETISEQTKILMFMEYGQIVLEEYKSSRRLT